MVRPVDYAIGDKAASHPEFLVYRELLRRSLVLDLDFYFQLPFLSTGLASREKGSYIIDFLFNNPPGLAINVQGIYYHYQQGSHVIAGDRLFRAQMATYNITVIFVDEDDIQRDVRWVVGEALMYRDHSRVGG